MAASLKTCLRLWPPLYILLLVVASEPVLENATSTIVPTLTTLSTFEDIRTAGSSSSKGIRPGSIYQTAEFRTPYSNSSFTHLTVSETIHDVFVGAVDYLYSLDKDLNKKQEVKTGPELDSEKCAPPVDEHKTCASPLHYTHNVNKVLVIDEADSRLISCGTLFHGYCEKRQLANISIMEPRDVRSSVVTNNASASVVAFVAPGPSLESGSDQQRVLYVAVSWSKPEGILEDAPAFSSRKLTDFTLTVKDTRKFTSTSFNFEGQQRPQFPVQYLYGFSSEGFSYVLTVQKKDVVPENAPYYSVALRVCQTDVNFYSYVEMPLVCSFGAGSENNNYTILVAAHLAKAGRNLALSLGINIKTDVLFALFARVENHLTKPKAEALCIFNMDDVRRKFTDSVKRCFEGHGNSAGGHLGIARPCSKNIVMWNMIHFIWS